MNHKDKPKRTHKSIDPAALRAAEDAIDIREADKAMLEYERTGEAISLEELEKELIQYTRSHPCRHTARRKP